MPVSSRRGALAGVSLLTKSKPVAVAAQWAMYGAVAVAGPRVLPGQRLSWDAPGDPELWRDVADGVGGFDGVAVYERPQASREGVAAVLLRAGRPAGFLKVRPDAGELDREERALRAFAHGCSAAFRVPMVLGRGEAGGRHWMVIEAMPARPARPVRRPDLEGVVEAVQDALAPALPPVPEATEHWRPMHGDLTAWNLRVCGRGLPWLIDWEDAAWAPPHADLVYYRATASAALGAPLGTLPPDADEAAAFWAKRVEQRSGGDHDAALNQRLLDILRTL
ncbi:phosphotransferase [Actinomadura rupiterrae]|uniref:phosphotransferase n=1 Tax=Actinomadura rupiterrae TaxID=559627 RepID=UPI0020A38C88|nr:phosphotransferase [Actinomadura rupiterrae]MCP2336851.1 aminoglycoside phosphotransferase (APT) family kinase protein [Actinomadura rupiterrae]